MDIDTQELLEELLRNYAGTVFLVSHDRMFLDNVITQSIVFEGEGRLKEYIGGYQDYADAKAREEKVQAASPPAAKPERPSEKDLSGSPYQTVFQVVYQALPVLKPALPFSHKLFSNTFHADNLGSGCLPCPIKSICVIYQFISSIAPAFLSTNATPV